MSHLLLKVACEQFEQMLDGEAVKIALEVDFKNVGTKGRELGKGVVEGVTEGAKSVGHEIMTSLGAGTTTLKDKIIEQLHNPYVTIPAAAGLTALATYKLMKKKPPSQPVNIITR